MSDYKTPNQIVNDTLQTLELSPIFKNNYNSINLLDGNLSAALFYAVHYESSNSKNSLKHCKKLIEIALEHCEESDTLIGTFSSGIGGLAWLMLYLDKKNHINFDESYFEEFDEILKELAYNFFDQLEYDYLHGALGIGLYFILRKDKKVIATMLDKLMNISETNNLGRFWKKIDHYNNLKNNQYAINLGLSHGIPSILQFAIYVYKSSLETSISLQIIKDCFSFLTKMLDQSSSNGMIFPSSITFESDKIVFKKEGRLAWCYGDLTVFYTLLSCCDILGDESSKKRLLQLSEKLTQIKDKRLCKLTESNICHGYFGVSHIYQKLYIKYGVDSFKKASDYWWKKGVEDVQQENPISNYWQLFKDEQKRKSYGILTGISGLGLVSLSRLDNSLISENLNWDKILML